MASATYRMPFPPSVNSYWRHAGKRTYLTKRAREYRKWTHLVSVRTNGGVLFTGRLAVCLEFVAPNRRKYDLDNYVKAVLDALQHTNIFRDDEQIDELIVRRLHVEPPGCVDVTITEKEKA